MRILHTSDWHLGKYLDTYSRIPEQIEVLNTIIDITERENVDLIIISGDIYDNFNPPAEAEQLFYKAVTRLSNGGKRPVIVIAGNHDSENRLTASHPLAAQFGVFLLGKPDSIVPVGEYAHFCVANSGKGFFEISINGENAVIITIPYPSEKRLNEVIFSESTEKEMQKTYSDKIGEIINTLSQNYREDTINILTGHFYIDGGETSSSEREITLGGAFAVSRDMLPKAQYIAMGHLHRPQKIKSECPHTYYSGSILQYSKSEINYTKCVYIGDIKAGLEAEVIKIELPQIKPIKVLKVNSIENALEEVKLINNECWLFLEIETDRVLLNNEIHALHEAKKDIVEIMPIFRGETEREEYFHGENKSIKEEFVQFYSEQRQVSPSEEIVDLFLKLLSGEGEGYETD